jgi:diguanylate cyclase (GGDEF)-like protein
MKRLSLAFAILLGWALAASAAPPAPLTSLRAVHGLSDAEAARQPAAAFEATVTYRRPGETTLFIQDGNAAIYVWASTDFKMAPGDRVLVRGQVHESFRPIVIADDVTVLRHGELPKAIPATFDELIRAQRDCMRVAVRGKVLSAVQVKSGSWMTAQLMLLADGGVIRVFINSEDPQFLDGLLDAEIEAAGVASASFDGKMQKTGVSLSVSSIQDIKMIRRGGSSPWTLPVSQMDQILDGYHVKNLSKRVRVQGTITYYQPGSALVVQNGTKSLWVMTTREEPLRIGSQADVTGFPDVHDGFLALTSGEVKQSPVYSPVAPRPVTRSQLTSSKNVFDLVTIEGQVVTELREGAQDEYVLMSDGQKFSAIYRHPETGNPQLAPMKEVPLGSRVSVSGICILENSNPFNREVPFDILMRSPDDIGVVARPSPVNVRNLIVVVGFLLLAMIVVGFRSWAVERRVRRQTAELAALEHRRSQILEDINGSRPLAEIVEQIAAMVSLKLNGAPCWFQIADGARLGNRPPDTAAVRIVEEKILARTGPPLGAIFAGLGPLSKPHQSESEALSMGAELATLAIETRRLFSDLLHRSEFDMLTDIHNRFFLDKYLDLQIEEARLKASIFGLIYIDLDRFKQINDIYGHQAGDLYLQEAAERMKQQLRPHDLLARLGGDEFAVLVPVVRNRAEVEEIAHRLEHCFDKPFAFDGFVVRGAASVGSAAYPEDGTTKDSLLRAADAFMYVAKNKKRQTTAAATPL